MGEAERGPPWDPPWFLSASCWRGGASRAPQIPRIQEPLGSWRGRLTARGPCPARAAGKDLLVMGGESSHCPPAWVVAPPVPLGWGGRQGPRSHSNLTHSPTIATTQAPSTRSPPCSPQQRGQRAGGQGPQCPRGLPSGHAGRGSLASRGVRVCGGVCARRGPSPAERHRAAPHSAKTAQPSSPHLSSAVGAVLWGQCPNLLPTR